MTKVFPKYYFFHSKFRRFTIRFIMLPALLFMHMAIYCELESRRDMAEGWGLWGILGAWGAAIQTLACCLRIFAPSTILGLAWGHQGAFTRFLNNIDHAYNSVVHPKACRRKRLIHWIKEQLPQQRGLIDINSLWKNGSILCGLIESAIPGACPHHAQHADHAFRHGQMLAFKYLGVTPIFSETDFESEQPDPNQEKRLLRYYTAIRKAINQSHIRPVNIPDEPHLCLDYVARGMGLVMAQQGCKATFLLYPTLGQSPLPECISLTIRGPYGTIGVASIPAFKRRTTKFIPKCRSPQLDETLPRSLFSSAHNSLMRRLSSIDFVGHVLTGNEHTELPPQCINTIPITFKVTPEFAKVTYTPENAGIHELSLISKSSHIPGSPFVIVADEFESNANVNENSLTNFETTKKHRKIKRRKVIRRIVDFITEKMILTDDGRLEKMTEDITHSPDKKCDDVLTKATSCPELSEQCSCSSSNKPNKHPDDRIERLVGVCNQLLHSSARSKSVDILTASQHIFDGRPINIGVCNDHVVKELLLLITPPNSNTPIERFNFSISSEESTSSAETSPRYDNLMKTSDILSAKISAMKIREQFNKKHPTFHCLVNQCSDEILEVPEYQKPATVNDVLNNNKNESLVLESVKSDTDSVANDESIKCSVLINKHALDEHDETSIERPNTPLHRLGKEFSVDFINVNILDKDACIESLLNSVLSSSGNITSAASELDMDSIISAENLEEALQKYDAKIKSISVEKNANIANDNQFDLLEVNESPTKQIIVNDALEINENEEVFEDDRLDEYQILEEEHYNFEENAVLQNIFVAERNFSTDSAYLSIDEVNSSPDSNPNISPMNPAEKSVKKLESIPENDNEIITTNVSNNWNRFQQETYESNDYELNCDFMGPAEREIWGIGGNAQKESNEEGFGSLYTMQWTKTKSSEIRNSFVRILSDDTATMDSIAEEIETPSSDSKNNETLGEESNLKKEICKEVELDSEDKVIEKIDTSSTEIENVEVIFEELTSNNSTCEEFKLDKVETIKDKIILPDLLLDELSSEKIGQDRVDSVEKEIECSTIMNNKPILLQELTPNELPSQEIQQENDLIQERIHTTDIKQIELIPQELTSNSNCEELELIKMDSIEEQTDSNEAIKTQIILEEITESKPSFQDIDIKRIDVIVKQLEETSSRIVLKKLSRNNSCYCESDLDSSIKIETMETELKKTVTESSCLEVSQEKESSLTEEIKIFSEEIKDYETINKEKSSTENSNITLETKEDKTSSNINDIVKSYDSEKILKEHLKNNSINKGKPLLKQKPITFQTKSEELSEISCNNIEEFMVLNNESNKSLILNSKPALSELNESTIERPSTPLHRLGKEFSVDFIDTNTLDKDSNIEPLLNSVLSSNCNITSADSEVDMDSIPTEESMVNYTKAENDDEINRNNTSVINNNLIDKIVITVENNKTYMDDHIVLGKEVSYINDCSVIQDDLSSLKQPLNYLPNSTTHNDMFDDVKCTFKEVTNIKLGDDKNIINIVVKADYDESVEKETNLNNCKEILDIQQKAVNVSKNFSNHNNNMCYDLPNMFEVNNFEKEIIPKISIIDINTETNGDVVQSEDVVKSLFTLDLTKHIDTGIMIELNTPNGSHYKSELNDLEFVKFDYNTALDSLSNEQRSPTPSIAITEEILEDYNENYSQNSLDHFTVSQPQVENLTSTVHILVNSHPLDMEDSDKNSVPSDIINSETKREVSDKDNYGMPIYTLNKITTNDENGKTVTLINISKEQLDVAEEIQIRTSSVCNINQELGYDASNKNQRDSESHISHDGLNVDTSSQYDSEQEVFAVTMRVSHRKQYWDNMLSGRNESSSRARAITAKRLNNSHTAFLRRSDSLTRKKTRTQASRCPGTVYKWKQSFENQPHGDNITSKVEKTRKSNSFVNKWKRYWNDVVDKKSDKSVSIRTLDREYGDTNLFGIVANGLQKFDTSPRRFERWRRDLHNTARNEKSWNNPIKKNQLTNDNLKHSENEVNCLSKPDELLKLSKQMYYPENIFHHKVYHLNSSETIDQDKELNSQFKLEETSNIIVNECQEILEKRNYYWGCDSDVNEKVSYEYVKDNQNEVNQFKTEINNTNLPKKRHNTSSNCMPELSLNNINLFYKQLEREKEREREEIKYDVKNINTINANASLDVKSPAVCESQTRTQFTTRLLELQDSSTTNACNTSVKLMEYTAAAAAVPLVQSTPQTPPESRFLCTTNSKHFNQTGERPGVGVYSSVFNQHHNIAENTGAGNMDNTRISASSLEMQHTFQSYDESPPLIISADPSTRPAVPARENETGQQGRAVTSKINQPLQHDRHENELEDNSENQTCKSKARFVKAKQFFQTLEEININEQIRNLNDCEKLLHSTLTHHGKNKFMTQRNSLSAIPNNEAEFTTRARSLPASHCQTPDFCSLNSDDSQKTNVSERFFVQDLYRDVVGDDDVSSAGSFKGIPHKQAVLAALNSMNQKSKYNNSVEQSDSIFSLTQAYESGYPYITTTAPEKFRPRSVGSAFDLIPRRVLIYNSSVDNSNS